MTQTDTRTDGSTATAVAPPTSVAPDLGCDNFCGTDREPLSNRRSNARYHKLDQSAWKREDDALVWVIEFRDRKTAMSEVVDKFRKAIEMVADKLDHHPSTIFCFKSLAIRSTTHAAGNRLTDSDYDLAEELTKLFAEMVPQDYLKVQDQAPAPAESASITADSSGGDPGDEDGD